MKFAITIGVSLCCRSQIKIDTELQKKKELKKYLKNKVSKKGESSGLVQFLLL